MWDSEEEERGEEVGEKVRGTTATMGTSIHTEESQKLVENQNNDRDNNFLGKSLPDEANTAFLGGGGAVGSVFCTLLQKTRFTSTSSDPFRTTSVIST